MTSPGFASSKAIARFHLLQPHLEEDIPLACIAAECGIAERTLRRWLAAWRANGIQGLERARRSDAGNRRMLDPDLEGLVRSMAIRRPRPTAAAIHRKIQAEAKARGIAGTSYSVVASIVRGVKPARIALATDAAAYRDQHGFKVSMSGKGNCYDNSMVETFFKSIKAELIWRNKWDTRRQAEGAIFQYINGFYNPRRRHSSLGGKSPLAFERKAA